MIGLFQQGETVPIKIHLYNEDDELVNADEVVISIKDINETIKINEIEMVNDGIGEYTYNYLLDSDALKGMWKVIIKTTVSPIVTIRNGSFRVGS